MTRTALRHTLGQGYHLPREHDRALHDPGRQRGRPENTPYGLQGRAHCDLTAHRSGKGLCFRHGTFPAREDTGLRFCSGASSIESGSETTRNGFLPEQNRG